MSAVSVRHFRFQISFFAVSLLLVSCTAIPKKKYHRIVVGQRVVEQVIPKANAKPTSARRNPAEATTSEPDSPTLESASGFVAKELSLPVFFETINGQPYRKPTDPSQEHLCVIKISDREITKKGDYGYWLSLRSPILAAEDVDLGQAISFGSAQSIFPWISYSRDIDPLPTDRTLISGMGYENGVDQAVWKVPGKPDYVIVKVQTDPRLAGVYRVVYEVRTGPPNKDLKKMAIKHKITCEAEVS